MNKRYPLVSKGYHYFSIASMKMIITGLTMWFRFNEAHIANEIETIQISIFNNCPELFGVF